MCGLEAVDFPAVRFPPKPPKEGDTPWEYKLWGLTLGMTSEILAAGGQPALRVESNSCTTDID